MVDKKYKLSISLNVLNHLGINLYSNVPAVVSEMVANCWDADADVVEIKIDAAAKIITITDDGVGMSHQEINDRFLKVGYEKRKDPNVKLVTKKHRHVMGRKGIGKLSVFSVAEIIEVHSVKGSEKSGFVMSVKDIREKIDKEGEDKIVDYEPAAVPSSQIKIKKGTKIILRKLKKNVKTTAVALRKRLARRFSIIDEKFVVKINGDEISVKDRDYFNKLQYIWYFGNESKHFADLAKNAIQKHKLTNFIDENSEFKITGWIGTVSEQKDIDEENNIIVLLAHGKLIQEDVLVYLKQEKIYTYYLMGEINADFLDADEEEDIVTSDRQRIKEDDERYKLLKKFILEDVLNNEIKLNWEKWRRAKGLQEAKESFPVIEQWFNRLTGDNKRAAEDLFGKINTLRINDPKAKKELYRASIIAFEKLARKKQLDALQDINSETDFALVKSIFTSVDEIEALEYFNITKGRLEVLKKFEKLLPNAKEKILQKYLFKRLWLINPAWERATDETKAMEQTVSKILKTKVDSLLPAEKVGRLDLCYKESALEHVIIELKKYDAKVEIADLFSQIQKYKSAFTKVLDSKFPNSPEKSIKVICVLGEPPRPYTTKKSIEQHQNALKVYDAEFITYDELIADASASYLGYMEKEKEISELAKIIDKIEKELSA